MFVSLSPRGLLRQVCSPGYTYFFTFLKRSGPQQPATPFLYYRELPGRRFGLLYNEKMKHKGVPEHLKKWFKFKAKNLLPPSSPTNNSRHKHHREQQNHV